MLPKFSAAVFFSVIACFVFGESPSLGPLQLYGGKTASTYLGCINCSQNDSVSIWNKRNEFGRVTSDLSIWNKRGLYGSSDSQFSPWNYDAEYPPIILDNQGEIYGRFTLNRRQEATNLEWAAWILSNYEEIRLNLDEYRSRF